MAKEIKVTLWDPQDADNQKFANFLDANILNAFIKQLKDTSEKRSLEELFEAWLNGEL